MNIALTRAADNLPQTVNIFLDAGLKPYCLPLIATTAVKPGLLNEYYDLCVITSPEAVKYFAGLDKTPAVGRFAAVGSVTAAKIRDFFPDAEILMPERFYAESIKEMLQNHDLKGKSVLLPGPEKRAADLSAFFTQSGALPQLVTTYKTVPVIYKTNSISGFLQKHSIDWVCFFSPSAVDSFFSQNNGGADIKYAVIGTTTYEAIKSHGAEAHMPDRQTAEGLAQKMAEVGIGR